MKKTNYINPLQYFFILFILSFNVGAVDKSGVKPNVLSLPSGPSSIEGLGKSFEPQLNTGSASYSVAIQVPPGTAGHQPSVSLNYSGGKGSSHFGIGWSLNLQSISRQTDKGTPSYTDSDTFIFSNGEELVPLSNGTYRTENESSFMRFRRIPGDNGWEITDKAGRIYRLGQYPDVSNTTRVSRVGNGGNNFNQTYKWYITSFEDTNGNKIEYFYSQFTESPGELYLNEIRYNLNGNNYNSVHFQYALRPDAFSDYTAGFKIKTAYRADKIRVLSRGSLVREYLLDYDSSQSELYGPFPVGAVQFNTSILTKVTQLDNSGTGLNYLPPIRFGYTQLFTVDQDLLPIGNFPGPEDIDLNGNGALDQASSVVFQSAPINVNFQDGNADLLDVNADGLPDVLHTEVSSGSKHAYYLNLDGVNFAPQAEMLNRPFAFLESSGTMLADINGDGVSDLINKPSANLFTLFSNRANGSWAPGISYTNPMSSDITDPNVRMMDIDFDKKIDVVRSTSGSSWEICRHGTEADLDRAPYDNFPSPEDIDHNSNGSFDDGSWNCSANNPMPFLPSVVFSNPEVHLIDFNGDRLQDVAWLRLLSPSEAVVVYWPNQGDGQFGEQILMPTINPATFNNANIHLSDVNGDGLPDIVKIISGLTTVWFNTGNQWSAPTSFNSPAYDTASTKIRFADMNGNGSRDVLWVKATGSDRYQYLDFTPLVRPNLLNFIDNGLGRQIKIQYKSSTKYAIDAAADGNPWTKFSPTPTSVVSRMVVTPNLELDGIAGQDQYITDYVYRNPYYDTFENEFRGFEFVKKIERGDADAPTQVTRYFFHTGAADGIDNDGDGKVDERSLTGGAEDEPLKGRILSQEVTTVSGGADTSLGDGQPANDSATFSRVTNQWQLRQIYAQTNGSQPQFTLNDSVVSYAYVEQADTQILELGSGAQKNLLSTFAYDDFGNQTEERNFGVDGINGDERFTFTNYINNTSLWNVGLPSTTLVTDGSLNKVTETRNYYDGQDFIGLSLGQVTSGNLKRQEQWVETTNYIQAKRNRYDSYGNITGSYDPEGSVGENKHFSEIVYDNIFHLFPVSETLHVGDGNPALGMIATYDLGLGIMLSSTDFNFNTTQYNYDSFGRMTSLVKPGDSAGLPTVSYTYRMADPVRAKIYNYDAAGNLSLQSGSVSASSVETRQREVSGEVGTLDALQYVDGMGRKLANVQEDNIGWVVNKFTQFNARGTARKTYQPFTISSSIYSQLNQGTYLTQTRYDAIGRPVEITNPPETEGGATTQLHTSFSPLHKTILDELNKEKVYINDGLKRLIEVQEVNKSERYITRYTYNPVDSLTLITDAQLNQRIFNYDGLQRRIFMNDPNKGVMNWIYDNASNVVETLDAKGQRNQFNYDGVNRILTEDYLDEGLPFSANVSPDVSYIYDSATSVDQGDGTSQSPTNTIGRLVSVTDLSSALISLPNLPAGEEHHSYDARGRNIWTVKRIADIKTNTLVSYKTSMDYDSFNRVTDITYPDGDHISQTYNERGLLDSINGGSSGFIVNNLQYKASGQLAHSQFGNGTVTDLEYDPRLRMMSLQSSGSSISLMNYAYSFDGVSNVSRIDDNRSVTDVAQGDPERNTQIFTYDDLYRIENVQYSFNAPGNADRNDGSIAYSYDKIGNMISKTSGMIHLENGLSITNLGAMTYGGSANGNSGRVGRSAGDAPGPHALSSVTDGSRNYGYDDNGNMLDINGKQLTWDFMNRLVAVEDSNMRAEYSYDHNNQRVMKHVASKANNARARPETTLYINDTFEVREYDQPVKYVLHNGKRIARATENLDSFASRTQRLRLATGWNILAIAINATDTIAQLGLGNDSDILSAYLWNTQTSNYDALNSGSLVPSGSVIWIESSANKVVSISGSYSDPSAPITSVGSAFIAHANLSYALSFGDDLPTDATQAWVFDASQQRWTALLDAPLAAISDLPENLPPGGVAYVTSTTSQVWNTPTSDSVLQYYHQDHLGSNDTITNNFGGVQSKNKFYPFGYNRQIGWTTKGDPYGFTDKEKDKESRLNYFEARYLGTDLGRFASVDPVLFTDKRYLDPQRWNVYAYARNNPGKFVDPDGEFIFLTIAVISAGITAYDTYQTYQTQGAAAAAKTLAVDGALSLAGLGVLKVAGKVYKKAKSLLKSCCFVAGTQVLTIDGYKNIEDIKLGEKLWAKNVETGQQEWKPVTKIFVEPDRGIYQVILKGQDGFEQKIEATDDHPFYVIDQGWKTTIELQTGDQIETDGHDAMTVLNVIDEKREDLTYNFTVADFHTYYVSKRNVLVHNCEVEFGKIIPKGDTKRALKEGLPERNWPTIGRMDDLKKVDLNNPADIVKTIYNKTLQKSKMDRFENGATLLKIKPPGKTLRVRPTNTSSKGIPQYRVEGAIPKGNIEVVK